MSRRSRRSGGICVASRACWRSFGPPRVASKRGRVKTAPSEALEGNVSTSEQRVASPHAEKTYTALQDTEADLLQLCTLGSDHIYTRSRPCRPCRRASSSGGVGLSAVVFAGHQKATAAFTLTRMNHNNPEPVWKPPPCPLNLSPAWMNIRLLTSTSM